MQIPEFNSAAHTYRKRQAIVTLGPILIAFVGMMILLPFRDQLEAALSPTLGTPGAKAVQGLIVALPFLLAFVVVIPLARRTERQGGVRCPTCDKQLAERCEIVVASRNCPFCGNRVLDDVV